jgi:hypothetical protein
MVLVEHVAVVALPTEGCITTSHPQRSQKATKPRPCSPRSSRVSTSSSLKKQQRLLELKQNASANRAWFFGMLVTLYLVMALSICLPMVVSPGRARQLLTQSSLATPTWNKQPVALTPEELKGQFLTNTQVMVDITYADGTVTRTKANLQPAEENNNEPPEDLQIRINVEQGKVNGISYFHCGGGRRLESGANHSSVAGDAPATTPGSAQTTIAQDGIVVSETADAIAAESRDVVILDGGSFFAKEQYHRNTMGVKQQIHVSEDHVGERTFLELCHRADQRGVLHSITALDLDHAASSNAAAGPDVLLGVLEGLLERKKVSALPVAALVTPGRSAETIVDWILYGDIAVLTNRVARHWIPVAVGDSVLQTVKDEDDDDEDVPGYSASATPRNSSPWQVIEHWPVLAIYGSSDETGRQSAELLQTEASAEIAKVEGGRFCYLDSPEQFSDTIMDYLEKQLTGTTQQKKQEEILFNIPISFS